MRSKLLVLAGHFLILLGIAGLIYPDLPMPPKRSEFQIGTEKLHLESRRHGSISANLNGNVVACCG